MTTLWRENRRPDVCPICHRPERCKLSPDGEAVLCFRVADGAFRPAAKGVGWLHRLNGSPRHRPIPVGAEPVTDRASDGTLASVYPAMLAGLPLHKRHREQLRTRGLNDTAINSSGYATLPDDIRPRCRVAAELLERFGAEALRVPGIVRRERKSDGKPFAMVAGPAGLLIPVRSLDGDVHALKVRCDDVQPGSSRYLMLSGMGGTRNAARVHAPRGTQPAERVIVTEGELKADIVQHLTGWPVVSIPGVSVWRSVLPVLALLGASVALVAFDADFADKPEVGNALADFLGSLCAEGYSPGVLSWDGSLGKGIDDILAAGHRAEIVLTTLAGDGRAASTAFTGEVAHG